MVLLLQTQQELNLHRVKLEVLALEPEQIHLGPTLKDNCWLDPINFPGEVHRDSSIEVLQTTRMAPSRARYEESVKNLLFSLNMPRTILEIQSQFLHRGVRTHPAGFIRVEIATQSAYTVYLVGLLEI